MASVICLLIQWINSYESLRLFGLLGMQSTYLLSVLSNSGILPTPSWSFHKTLNYLSLHTWWERAWQSVFFCHSLTPPGLIRKNCKRDCEKTWLQIRLAGRYLENRLGSDGAAAQWASLASSFCSRSLILHREKSKHRNNNKKTTHSQKFDSWPTGENFCVWHSTGFLHPYSTLYTNPYYSQGTLEFNW